MATEENNSSTPETGDQESKDQQQQEKPGETPGEKPQPLVIDDSTKLPDTHPLVKSLGTLRAEIATQKTELQEARANSAKATQLQEELGKRPTQEAIDTLQTRYDRLESFVQAIPGLGKALDSRTFTKDLFETDKPIKDLVKDYQQANPTATSQALGGKAAQPADGKQDPNALIRAAWAGGSGSN